MAANAFDVTGKVALVTGASQGLGRHFAQVLARAGCKVALAARQAGKLAELERAIAKEGGTALAVALDVTKPKSIAEACDRLEDTLGPLSILVNNAGVAITKPVLEQTEEDWDQVVGTNLKGAFQMAQEAARRMATHGGGSIINIASILGFAVIGHLAPYCAAKGGMIQFTKAMALELARNKVRVNAIAPGYIETEMNVGFFETEGGQNVIRAIPQRRIGKEADLDGALLLLASEAGAYMTGTVIVVDGGFLLG